MDWNTRGRCSPLFISIAWAVTAAAGCASDRVAGPAGEAAKYVSAFQSDLATLQSDLTEYQKQQASINAERAVDTLVSQATRSQTQNVMNLFACTTPGAVFSTLQMQGNTAVAGEIAATSAPAAVSAAALPTDKLAAVAASLSKLTKKPGTKADVEFLLAYGKSIGKNLKAPAASTVVSPPAASPASAPAASPASSPPASSVTTATAQSK